MPPFGTVMPASSIGARFVSAVAVVAAIITAATSVATFRPHFAKDFLTVSFCLFSMGEYYSTLPERVLHGAIDVCGDYMTLALRFYQLSYLHDSLLLFMFHGLRLPCFTERGKRHETYLCGIIVAMQITDKSIEMRSGRWHASIAGRK